MALSFCSFSSGSSGNCYLIKSRETALLVDAGISAKRIVEGLSLAETSLDAVQGLLITHEHTDHVKSAATLIRKKPDLPVYANEKTFEAAGLAVNVRGCIFEKEKPFRIGDIEVKAFPVSHDAADPVGFSLYSGGKQISILTDSGYVEESLLPELAEADLLVLEANYDRDMLKMGRYPWFLKQRIDGDRGHLSNEAAGETILRLLSGKSKNQRVILAHLSRENNFPAMAYQTVKNILEEGSFYLGKHLNLSTVVRDEVSAIFET